MGKISTYAKNKMIDHVFKASYTPASTLYLCLCTSDPGVDSTGSTIAETNYTGYSRVSFTGSTKFAAASARKIVQNALITFGQATSVSASDISHWAICDASTAGNMLAAGSFTASWNTVSGNTPKIASGEIEIEIESTVTGAGFTTAAANLLLDHVFLNDIWTSPANSIYCGLTTATMTEASTLATLTECSTANGYAREAIPAASFNAASSGANVTNADIAFNIPTGNLGTITSFFVCNSASGTSGVLISFDNDNITDQPVNIDDEVVVESGSFTCTLN